MSKTTFTIDRATWRCGGDGPHKHGTGTTRLLGADGCNCCLGFIALQLGESVDVLGDWGDPSEMLGENKITHSPLDPLLVRKVHCDYDDWWFSDTDFTNAAMKINDDPKLTRIQRERGLERLAEEHGLRIEFTGKYTDEE